MYQLKQKKTHIHFFRGKGVLDFEIHRLRNLQRGYTLRYAVQEQRIHEVNRERKTQR
jgi:hypothetical protein